jgi:GT2 family glycosyltransferase
MISIRPGCITVSVVSHLQGKQVELLLRELDAHCRAVIDLVILTCNLPETLPFALSDFDMSVKLVVNTQPQGFGTNHNRAFSHCKSAWFLIINPDVRIGSDVLSALLARARAQDAIVAPQEADENGVPLDSPRGPPTPLEILRRRIFKREGGFSTTFSGIWVKGMFMLTRSCAFAQVHGFDERFFLYGEDVDLCARLLLANWQVAHISQVSVYHSWQRASSHSWRHLVWHVASLLRLWTKSSFWRYWALARRLNSKARGNDSDSKTI